MVCTGHIITSKQTNRRKKLSWIRDQKNLWNKRVPSKQKRLPIPADILGYGLNIHWYICRYWQPLLFPRNSLVSQFFLISNPTVQFLLLVWLICKLTYECSCAMPTDSPKSLHLHRYYHTCVDWQYCVAASVLQFLMSDWLNWLHRCFLYNAAQLVNTVENKVVWTLRASVIGSQGTCSDTHAINFYNMQKD